MKPLVQVEIDKSTQLTGPYDDEMWVNDTYVVLVNSKQKTGWMEENGNAILVTWLSIRRKDRAAIPDWRHFQWIKNQLVGEENEGMEIYPAESRLMDTANSYHLWVFEDNTTRLPFGFPQRNVTNRATAGAIQRPFPVDRMPIDAEENYQKTLQQIEKIKKQK